MPMPTPSRDWSDRSLELSRLLARSALGDSAAFATFYRLTSAHLLGVVSRIHSDRAQAEDVLQEVYVNVWKAAATFDAAQSQPLTWLTSIARNRAIDTLRRVKGQPVTVAATATDADDAPTDLYELVEDPAAGPLELLSRAADARALDACFERLSPAQRQSLALAFFDGQSHAEVAATLRQPLGTVKSWVRRALALLKTCLEAAARRDADALGR